MSRPHPSHAAGTVLGRAFVDDPLWRWALRGRAREARLILLFTELARAASRAAGAQVLVTPERTAAAVWLPPAAWRGTTADFLRSAPRLALAMRGGVVRGLRLQSVLERDHLREPHWYLEAVGAVPTARGTGAGRRVVQPVLDICDDQRLPAYLESSNPRNWSFYERLGFARLSPLPLPRGCPLVMPMRREPG